MKMNSRRLEKLESLGIAVRQRIDPVGWLFASLVGGGYRWASFDVALCRWPSLDLFDRSSLYVIGRRCAFLGSAALRWVSHRGRWH